MRWRNQLCLILRHFPLGGENPALRSYCIIDTGDQDGDLLSGKDQVRIIDPAGAGQTRVIEWVSGKLSRNVPESVALYDHMDRGSGRWFRTGAYGGGGGGGGGGGAQVEAPAPAYEWDPGLMWWKF